MTRPPLPPKLGGLILLALGCVFAIPLRANAADPGTLQTIDTRYFRDPGQTRIVRIDSRTGAVVDSASSDPVDNGTRVIMSTALDAFGDTYFLVMYAERAAPTELSVYWVELYALRKGQTAFELVRTIRTYPPGTHPVHEPQMAVDPLRNRLFLFVPAFSRGPRIGEPLGPVNHPELQVYDARSLAEPSAAPLETLVLPAPQTRFACQYRPEIDCESNADCPSDGGGCLSSSPVCGSSTTPAFGELWGPTFALDGAVYFIAGR
jgi:hypothetical protein